MSSLIALPVTVWFRLPMDGAVCQVGFGASFLGLRKTRIRSGRFWSFVGLVGLFLTLLLLGMAFSLHGDWNGN
jgi:hypothetical protein